MAHADAMADMSKEMAAAGDMAMPEGCDACGGGADDMAAGACAASCSLPGAVLTFVPSLADDPGSPVVATVNASASERHRPPDLHPPRLTVTA